MTTVAANVWERVFNVAYCFTLFLQFFEMGSIVLKHLTVELLKQ